MPSLRASLRSGTLAPLLLALLAFAPVSGAQPSPIHPRLGAFVDSLERAGFSGTVLVADTGRVHLVRAMGLADRRTARRLTVNDRWRWASVSKQITAALVLREVDAGRIALDTPAVRYLPAFSGAGRERITVRHLLQHTSGLENMEAGPSDADGMPRVYRDASRPVGDDAFTRTCTRPMVAPPGERFDYNNCDYVVLGALLRARTGRSTFAHMQSLLGTSVRDPETVRGYVTADRVEPSFDLAAYGSSGAMTGTVQMLLAFDRLLLGALLSPGARAELWRGAPQFGFAALGAWSFEAPLTGCAAPVRLVERRGAIQGIQVRNVLLPDLGLVVMVFTNRGDLEFGEVWQQRGLLFDLLRVAACGGTS